MMPAEQLVRSFRVQVEGGVALCLLDVPGETGQHHLAGAGRRAHRAPPHPAGRRGGEGRGPRQRQEGQLHRRRRHRDDPGRPAARARRRPSRARRRPASTSWRPWRSRWWRPSTAPAWAAGWSWPLACRWRIATDDRRTQLGLPEVQLGLIPGAGGTQRLPRLIGIAAALDIILAGKSVKARKAHKLGLVDEVVPPAILLEVAKRRALELAERQGAAGEGERRGGPAQGGPLRGAEAGPGGATRSAAASSSTRRASSSSPAPRVTTRRPSGRWRRCRPAPRRAWPAGWRWRRASSASWPSPRCRAG